MGRITAALILSLAAGCAGASATSRVVAAPSQDVELGPAIDEATYRAVLDAVFASLETEVAALEEVHYNSLDQAEGTLAPYTTPSFEDRMNDALAAHEVTKRQMSDFALSHPEVVRSVNTANATRMYGVNRAADRILARVASETDSAMLAQAD